MAPQRLSGWVDRYAATHPGTTAEPEQGSVRLTAEGGATAVLTPLLPFRPAAPTGAGDPGELDQLVAELAHHAAQPVVTALLLIRRGGYAVGIAEGATLLRSKIGSRYVQSRTAAGGWSQQRFARRREGQAKELVRAAAQAWAQLEPADSGPVAVLVTGGDRALGEAVLQDDAARDLAALGSARHLDTPDPKLAVLQLAAARAQALVVTVREP